MMYRTPPHAPRQEIARFSDINDVAEPGIARAVAYKRSIAHDLIEAEHVCQNGTGRGGLGEHQSYSVETADRVFCRDIAVAPPLLISRTVNADQGQSHPIGIGQRQYWLIEAPLDRAVLNSFFDQTMCPIAERRRRNPEGGLPHEAHPRATR